MDFPMDIPSDHGLRGQRDAVGFASTREAMAAVYELSGEGPEPSGFPPREGEEPPAGLPLGALSPHDDYLYAGRVYRRVLPRVKARTVVLVGVFHKYRFFGAELGGRAAPLVYDAHQGWRSPDGPIRVSALREEVTAALPGEEVLRSDEMHEAEQSLEAVAYWLKHDDPDLEILPILVPKASFSRLELLARDLATALAAVMARRGLSLGKDLAVVVSSDAVHYGADFGYTPFGLGGDEALARARARDRSLLEGPLSGQISADSARSFFEACVDPESLDTYRHTWCGRFALPLGLLLMAELARASGREAPWGQAIAYAATVDAPELPARGFGLGTTAPASLSHFVGLPAALYY